MRSAVLSGSADQVTALFARPGDSEYIFRMAPRLGGLKNLQANVFSAPKGWESKGAYWATFHAWQELEQDHDPVYTVEQKGDGWKLGREIPEYECGGRLSSAQAKVDLNPADGSLKVAARISYTGATAGKSLLFRFSDAYSLAAAPTQNGAPLRPEDWSRTGGLLTVVPTRTDGEITLSYSAKLGKGALYSDDRDQVTEKAAYITSYWIPSLGRLPFRTEISISGPQAWVLSSEGEEISTKPDPDRPGFKIASFRCDIPISYPKVVAGAYVVAAEGTQNGKLLRSYQFEPVDKVRAQKDLDWMKKSVTFYEKNLVPFPFTRYFCFDGDNYYGIESYSYTLLAPTITTWAVSHEMGHTYFGGVAPCAYVKDSWNEGLTQYIDDHVLHGGNGVAKNALAQIDVAVPVAQMPIAWEYGGATYYRGGYIMQMLEQEIGQDKVLAGMRAMLKDRVGKETVWADLRQYFEKVSGRDLGWYWNQWVFASQFPTLDVLSAREVQKGKGRALEVRLRQTGTPAPYRMKFKLVVSGPAGTYSIPVTMTQAEQTISRPSLGKYTSVSVDVMGGALARVGKTAAIVR